MKKLILLSLCLMLAGCASLPFRFWSTETLANVEPKVSSNVKGDVFIEGDVASPDVSIGSNTLTGISINKPEVSVSIIPKNKTTKKTTTVKKVVLSSSTVEETVTVEELKEKTDYLSMLCGILLLIIAGILIYLRIFKKK